MIIKWFSPIKLTASLVVSAIAFLFRLQPVASVLVQDERLAECNVCEELTEDRQCRVCTCFVDAKTALNLEKCPKGKWKRNIVRRD